MTKPTIILATSNGIGMGHLTRASAVASELKDFANPIIISMASGVVEVPKIANVNFEYVPGRDRKWMGRFEWDKYLFSFSVPICRNTCIIYIRPSRG